jgi:hypothetical protein
MGPLLIVFVERALVDYIEKLGRAFAVGLGSWFGCYRELVPNFMRLHILHLEIVT